MDSRAKISSALAASEVVFIKLTGRNRSRDMAVLIDSGTIVGGPQAGVFGVTSRRQLEALRRHGVAFEEIGRSRAR
jgi:hypothetical protein